MPKYIKTAMNIGWLDYTSEELSHFLEDLVPDINHSRLFDHVTEISEEDYSRFKQRCEERILTSRGGALDLYLCISSNGEELCEFFTPFHSPFTVQHLKVAEGEWLIEEAESVAACLDPLSHCQMTDEVESVMDEFYDLGADDEDPSADCAVASSSVLGVGNLSFFSSRRELPQRVQGAVANFDAGATSRPSFM